MGDIRGRADALMACSTKLASFYEKAAEFIEALSSLDVNKIVEATDGGFRLIEELVALVAQNAPKELLMVITEALKPIDTWISLTKSAWSAIRKVLTMPVYYDASPYAKAWTSLGIANTTLRLWLKFVLIASLISIALGYWYGSAVREGVGERPTRIVRAVEVIRALEFMAPTPEPLVISGVSPPIDEEQARNLRAAEEMAEELKAKYMGKWVAISGGELIAVADSFRELAERMRGKITKERAVVMKVGEHEPGKVARGWWSGFL